MARKFVKGIQEACRRLPRIILAAAVYAVAAGGVGLVVYGCNSSPVPGMTINPPAETLTNPPTAATVSWDWGGTFTACKAADPWPGSTVATGDALPLISTQAVAPAAVGIYAYQMTCVDGSSDVPVNEQVILNVYSAPTIALSSSLIDVTQTATLTWSATGATRCKPTGSAPWSGQTLTLPSGSFVISEAAAGTYNFGITCTEQIDPTIAKTINATAGPVTLQVTSTPPSTPTVILSVSPTSIALNTSATLQWSSTNATGCTASGDWSGSQATGGTLTVSPSASGTYSYILTCSGTGGSANATAVLIVNPPPTVAISVNPTMVPAGSAPGPTLTWSATNADSCTTGGWPAPQTPLPLNGSTVVTTPTAVGSQTYTLNCTGPGGQASASTVLTVTATLSSITVAPASASIAVNASQQLTVTGTFSDGSTQDLTTTASFSSAQPTIASVTQGGLVSGVAVGGPVLVTAQVLSNGQTLSATSSVTVTPGVSGSVPCNAAPSPKGGGVDAWDNQSFCATFSGETDQLYNFTGTLTFTTPLTPGPVLNCQFASAGTVGSTNPTPASTPPTTCNGSTAQGSTTLNVADSLGNVFAITFTPSGSTVNISGNLNFGAFGPGFGVAFGSLTGGEQ
jgi:hypothetical protein